MTRRRTTVFITAVGVLAAVSAQAAESILFIGNSFTFGWGSPVRHYRADSVRDLNGEGIGGVPALFAAFATQAGLEYEVALETRGGSGLDWHLANKAEALGARPWDAVVMHGFSTLDRDDPGNPQKLVQTAAQMAELLRSMNADVALYLTATWARADQVYAPEGAWQGQPVFAMARDIQAAYEMAASASDFAAVAPVGEAWSRAMRSGFADPNPYDGLGADQVDLWSHDHYHASAYGYFLEALMVFGTVTGLDPRVLGGAECSGYELGFSTHQVETLQRIAAEELLARALISYGQPVAPAAQPPAPCGPVRSGP